MPKKCFTDLRPPPRVVAVTALDLNSWIRTSFYGGFVLVVCLLGMILMSGCRRGETDLTSREVSGATNPVIGVVGTVEVIIPTNLPVPFRGIITAREQRDLTLNNFEITYTIGERSIRREAVRKVPFGQLSKAKLGTVGIICDLVADRVVFYRSGMPGKFYSRTNLAGYRKLVSGAEASDASWALLREAPFVWQHAGTFFMDVPQPIPSGQVVNLPNARTFGGLPCDLLTIRWSDTVLEVHHCQQIRVERELLELVELRLPAEVTGFPCLMRQLQQISVKPAAQSDSKGQTLLKKGVNWAAKLAEQALKLEWELVRVTHSNPPDSAFTLDDGFVEVSTLEELHLHFAQSKGGHDDWD